MCQQCGEPFSLPSAVQAKYPGWSPKTCLRCRERAERPAGGAAGAQPPPGRRKGWSPTRELNLTVAQVMARFSDGPQTGVFTDGSCAGNPGPGGWGAVRVEEGRVVSQRHAADPATTNNRMELTAIIEGLRMVAPHEALPVFSDSQLVVNTLTKWAAGWEARGWKRKEGEVKNLDLVREAFALVRARPRVRIQWIRAHDGSLWNEYADSLSTAYLRDEL